MLVTGGAGFIGSHLCEALLDKGHSVVCVDNFNDYYNPKAKEKNVQKCLKSRNYTLLRKDITDFAGLGQIFKEREFDQVVHIAAAVGVRDSIERPLLFEKVNVGGTLNLLELCNKFGVKKFIFASSSSVYGENKKIPFSESDATDNIVSPYAATKKAAEILCETYSRLYGINVTCLRFFTVYGPRGRPEMAPFKFAKIIDEEKEVPMFGDGSSKRDYTYISDIIKGIMAAVGKEFRFEVINLGNSSPVELRELVSVIEKVVGKKARIKKMPLQKGDVPLTFADVSKAKRLLGYEPKVRLEEGIKSFFEWYKNSSG